MFLPGAAGDGTFWKPVAALFPRHRLKQLVAWPGLGNQPHDTAVSGLEDLVELVLGKLTEPTDLIAQSMGGLVAVKVALAAPDKIRRMVLTATSGGIPVASLGGIDWRPAYREEYPDAVSWITEVCEDLSEQIPSIETPTLLLWGDMDLISPVAAGERLAALLPSASLHVVRGGDHDLARTHAAQIGPIIAEFLQ